MPIEPSVNWFSDYDINQPQDGDDLVEGDNHIRNLKKSILAPFPSLGDVAMTATANELNALDLTTGAGTAEANKALVLDGSLNIGTINQLTATTLVSDALTKTVAGDLAISAASGNVTVEGLTFNGTDVTGATSITSTAFVGALTGNVVGNVTGDLTGNADTATAFNSSRTISLTGDVTGSNASSNGAHSIVTQLAAGSVNFANEITLGTATGSQVVALGSTWTIPRGVYNVRCTADAGVTHFVEIRTSGGWTTLASGGIGTGAHVVSDGSNFRIRSAATGPSTWAWEEIYN